MQQISLEDALLLFTQGDYENSISAIEYYADCSEIEALSKLGLAYQLGLGVPIDFVKAEQILKKAAKLGSGEASHNLGTLYATRPNADNILAKKWFENAKKLGFNPGF